LDEKLPWPPKKEDLERLYLVERLSASKIAMVYGLHYKNPKVAESTVLYHLKRNGIKRRDAVALATKFSEETVDEWVRRYQAGESLKDIAGGELSPVTVYLRLRKRGIELRDKVEAQIKAVTKYQRASFKGDSLEKAYLIGFRLGDLHVVRHGRAIRVRVSTTHPAMIELFGKLFSAYGPIYRYPKESELTGYEWSLDCDLDSSFAFLLDPQEELDEIMSSRELFFAFLAGFFDADGSIYYHRKATHGGFEFTLTNMDVDLLRRVAGRLSTMGLHARVRLSPQKKDRGVKNGGQAIWKLSLWRFDEVSNIVRTLPIRHREKMEKKSLVLRLEYRQSAIERASLIGEWDKLRASFKDERSACITAAQSAYRGKNTAQIGRKSTR
jgi:hypothetical protein